MEPPRFSLTRFDLDQVPELLALFQDPHVRRFLLDDAVVDRAWVEAEVEASEQRFGAGEIGLFAARDAQGVLFGFCGMRPFFDPPVPQLLYGLRPAYTGRGYATAMARQVLAQLRAAGARTVNASVDAPNRASQRVLLRLGFALTRASDGQLHYTLTFG
jgi:RimJ/RimL family protein N-acetyltransferase